MLLGHPAYRAPRPPSPYRNSQDPIAGAHPGLVRVRRLQDAAGTLEGEFTIGIART
ncbi:hypothetical protein ACU4GD_18765 [Cupriavidus basilensis]